MRGAVLCTLTGIIFLALFIPINMLRELEQIAVANLVIIGILLANLLLLYRHRTPKIAAAIGILAVAGWFLVSAVSGGPELFFWIYVLPWVVFFFFGLRGGLVWTLGLAAYFLALLHFLPIEFRHGFVPFTIFLSFVAVSGLAAIYEYLTQVYQASIEDVSHRDFLTRAWNRRKFGEVVRVEIARARRYARPLCLLILDVDEFKRVNDNYGHTMGDEVLRELAMRIQAELRQSDYLFRWGGDEFIILATETGLGDPIPTPPSQGGSSTPTSRADAAGPEGGWSLARKVQRAAAGTAPGGEPLSVSLGLAELLADDTEDSLVRRADDALYVAKQRGRHRIEVAPPR